MRHIVFFRKATQSAFLVMIIVVMELFLNGAADATQLKAGVAKVNITNTELAGLVNDSLYVKALVLDNGSTMAVIITVDAIAIGGIGSINNDYLVNVRSQIQEDLNINATNVLVNASHLHGAGYQVCSDIEERTILAVKKAWQNMVPVNIGVGIGYEERIMENRRLVLKNGKEWTIRHANPLPPNEDVIGNTRSRKLVIGGMFWITQRCDSHVGTTRCSNNSMTDEITRSTSISPVIPIYHTGKTKIIGAV